MNKGVIKNLNDKGFGFIKVDGLGKDLFFHASALRDVKFMDLQVGDEVFFDEIEQTQRGQSAIGITLQGNSVGY